MKRTFFGLICLLVVWNVGMGFFLVREIGKVDRFYTTEVNPAIQRFARLREITQEALAQQRCLYNFMMEHNPSELTVWGARLEASRANTFKSLDALDISGASVADLSQSFRAYVNVADRLRSQVQEGRSIEDCMTYLRADVRPALERYIGIQQSLANELERGTLQTSERFSAEINRERTKLLIVVAVPAVLFGLPLIAMLVLWGALAVIAARGDRLDD